MTCPHHERGTAPECRECLRAEVRTLRARVRGLRRALRGCDAAFWLSATDGGKHVEAALRADSQRARGSGAK